MIGGFLTSPMGVTALARWATSSWFSINLIVSYCWWSSTRFANQPWPLSNPMVSCNFELIRPPCFFDHCKNDVTIEDRVNFLWIRWRIKLLKPFLFVQSFVTYLILDGVCIQLYRVCNIGRLSRMMAITFTLLLGRCLAFGWNIDSSFRCTMKIDGQVR